MHARRSMSSFEEFNRAYQTTPLASKVEMHHARRGHPRWAIFDQTLLRPKEVTD